MAAFAVCESKRSSRAADLEKREGAYCLYNAAKGQYTRLGSGDGGGGKDDQGLNVETKGNPVQEAFLTAFHVRNRPHRQCHFFPPPIAMNKMMHRGLGMPITTAT